MAQEPAVDVALLVTAGEHESDARLLAFLRELGEEFLRPERRLLAEHGLRFRRARGVALPEALLSVHGQQAQLLELALALHPDRVAVDDAIDLEELLRRHLVRAARLRRGAGLRELGVRGPGLRARERTGGDEGEQEGEECDRSSAEHAVSFAAARFERWPRRPAAA